MALRGAAGAWRWSVEVSARWAQRARPEQLAALARPGRRATVAWLPGTAAGDMLSACRALRGADVQVACHVPAKRLASRAMAEDVLGGLAAAGVRELLLLGGDGSAEGPFSRAADLAELLDPALGFASVDVAAYPDGHALASDEDVARALRGKLGALAGRVPRVGVVTQLVLDWASVERWAAAGDAAGIAAGPAPVEVMVGVFGPVAPQRMLRVAPRLAFGRGLLAAIERRAAQSGADAPLCADAVLRSAAARGLPAPPALSLAGFHVSTFDRVDAALAWLDRRAAPLAPRLARGPL